MRFWPLQCSSTPMGATSPPTATSSADCSPCWSCGAATSCPSTTPWRRCGRAGCRPTRPPRCRPTSSASVGPCPTASSRRAAPATASSRSASTSTPSTSPGPSPTPAALLAADPAAAAALLTAALATWRGSPYPELADTDAGRAEAGRLDELRVRAVEVRADAQLRAGTGDDVLAELTALADEHPLRERPRSC